MILTSNRTTKQDLHCDPATADGTRTRSPALISNHS